MQLPELMPDDFCPEVPEGPKIQAALDALVARFFPQEFSRPAPAPTVYGGAMTALFWIVRGLTKERASLQTLGARPSPPWPYARPKKMPPPRWKF